MKPHHQEFIRYKNWKEQFVEDREKIKKREVEEVVKGGLQSEQRSNSRFIRALISMYVGGYEKRIEDPEIKYWTDWAGARTFKTFNGFPQLSDSELAFLFYALGKVFVPLLMHERGVKSESFKKLTLEEQERAVLDELEVIWENHLIRILQVMPFLGLEDTG